MPGIDRSFNLSRKPHSLKTKVSKEADILIIIAIVVTCIEIILFCLLVELMLIEKPFA
jgi:hypothetical protein